jgi:hypothetical protein
VLLQGRKSHVRINTDTTDDGNLFWLVRAALSPPIDSQKEV